MKLISKEEVVSILEHVAKDPTIFPGDKMIEEAFKRIDALPYVDPERIKANVKRLYRYEKAVAAKRRDGN